MQITEGDLYNESMKKCHTGIPKIEETHAIFGLDFFVGFNIFC